MLKSMSERYCSVNTTELSNNETFGQYNFRIIDHWILRVPKRKGSNLRVL